MSLTFRYTPILWLVQPENEKPVAESREEISNEKAKAESPISLSSELRRRSA
jgi:SNARE protein 1